METNKTTCHGSCYNPFSPTYYEFYNRKKKLLHAKGQYAVTLTPSYVWPKIFGKRLLSIPYQDYTGKTWYALAFPKNSKEKLSPNRIKIKYLPDSPNYAFPYEEVEEPFIAMLKKLEHQGFASNHLVSLEKHLENSHYLFGWVALLIFLLTALKLDLFAALLAQKMPPPLGPALYIHKTVILQNSIRVVLHLLVIIVLLFLSGSLLYPEKIPFALYFPFRFSGLWIGLSYLLPIFLCPYIAYYLVVTLPKFLRSFKKWNLEDTGISTKKITLKWEDIKYISTFKIPSPWALRFFFQPRRRVALLSSSSGKEICLEGDLVHFEGIVTHIKKKSKEAEGSNKKAKYFLRKKYSIPKLVRITTCLTMLLAIMLLFSFIRRNQRYAEEKGVTTQASVIYTFVKNFSLITYNDSAKRVWYSFGYKRDNKNQFTIRYLQSNPGYWKGDTWGLDPIDQYVKRKFYFFIGILSSSKVEVVVKYFFIGVSALMLLPFLWYLLGATLAFPPLSPDSFKKLEAKETLFIKEKDEGILLSLLKLIWKIPVGILKLLKFCIAKVIKKRGDDVKK